MKKSTKWVRFSVLWFAGVALLAVVAVLACGPAAPAQQAGSGGPVVAKEGSTETPTPTTTPYPDDCKRKWNHIIQEWEMVCPEPGSRKIDHNLRFEYNWHMEKKATRQARGETVDVIQRKVLIWVTTHAAVDAVVEYLEARTSNVIRGYKYPGGDGGVTGIVDIELLPALAERDDVVEIDLEVPSAPASLMRQSSNPTPTPTMTAVERVRVDQWHDAGVTGSGVQVAVIDFDFREFRTQVADPAVVNADPTKPDVHFFCYNAAGVATHTDFTFCETSSVNPRLPSVRPHGTDVVVALLENSPGATLLISNARGLEQLKQAVDWLTLGTADNSATDVDYNNACDASASDAVNAGCNDAFDVKVINHSQTHIWDGPGDGTSPFFGAMDRSPINTAGDAVSRGVVWVNAAGNQNESTWFDHNPVFNVTGRLSYNSAGGGLPDCNSFTVDANHGYTIQSRWSDDWDEADIDLDLEVYYLLGRVGISMDPQTGGSGHHPREFMTFPAGTLSSGTHCVVVSKDPGDPNDPNDFGEDVPDWVQVQIFAGPGGFAHSSRDPGHSISNPAESANPGLLAVGAASNEPTPALQDFSARGPIPSTGNPVKPDVVGLNTDLQGTSFASPRVAGEVALVVQGGGGVASPTRVAAAMKEHADHPSSLYPDQEWGHGLSKLPSMEAPAIVSVSHDPCSRQGALRVDYSHPAVGTYPMAFHLKAQQVSAQGTGVAAYEHIHVGTIRSNPREVHLDTGTDRGSYDVTARTCTEAGHCGPESGSPMRFTTAAKVCDPRWFRAVPGDEKATLWWNPDPDATGYQIQLVGGDPVTVTGAEHVIDGLVNGGLFRYRLQVLGPGGPSAWSGPRSVTPRESTSRPPVPTNLRLESNISRRFPGLQLRWDSPLGSYLYEIRVRGGGAEGWRRLPFQPSGWNSPYSARFFGGHQRVGDSFVLVGDAIIAGLIPGTQYHFAVRAARERDTGKGEKLERSPWSEPVTLMTPGVRPAGAPGSVTAPKLKAPPEDLMAVVNGTAVDLSWTAGTNPSYDRQVVLRREAVKNTELGILAVLGVDATSYTDETVESGKTYIYRIKGEKPPDDEGKRGGGLSNPQEVGIP